MKNLRWIVLGALFAAAGCGDDGGGGSDDKQINMLTPQEYDEFCMEANQNITSVITSDTEATCTFVSLGAGSTQACELGKQACLAALQSDAGVGIISQLSQCPEQDSEEISNCQVTVGQAKACMDALVQQTQSLFADASCDMASSGAPQSQPPTECQPLEGNCDAFLISSSDFVQ